MAMLSCTFAFCFATCIGLSQAGVRTLDARRNAGECATSDYGDMFVEGQITEPLPSTVVQQTEADVSAADLLDIRYGSNFKVMLEKHSQEMYVLTQCGSVAPNDETINAVLAKPPGYTVKHFFVPLQVVGTETTVVLEFFKALGLEDRVQYVSQYATGACWQKALGCGETANMTKHLPEVDAWFMDCHWSMGCSNVNAQPKGVHVSATQDPGPLHTAEHIKFISAFFNKEQEATQFFQAEVASYNSIAASYSTKPVVAWIEYNSWGTPAFKLSQAYYKLAYVEHAGGLNVDGDRVMALIGSQMTKSTVDSGSTFTLALSGFSGTPDEQKRDASAAFFAALKSLNVGVVIDETYAFSPSSYTLSTFYSTYGLDASSDLAFVTNSKVLRVDGEISESDGLDWFQSRIARPSWAAEGLARQLHGDSSKTLHFFRNIATGEQPAVTRASECTLTVHPVCNPSVYPERISMMTGTTGNREISKAASACGLGALLLLATLTIHF